MEVVVWYIRDLSYLWVSLVHFHVVLLRSVVRFTFYRRRHFNRSVDSLCVSGLLYIFILFFSWGSPYFHIFSALCFCVVSGAGVSVLSLLVHIV